MIIVSESAAALKGFLGITGLNELARTMLLRVVLAFIMHRGRMSCSAAAGSVDKETGTKKRGQRNGDRSSLSFLGSAWLSEGRFQAEFFGR